MEPMKQLAVMSLGMIAVIGGITAAIFATGGEFGAPPEEPSAGTAAQEPDGNETMEPPLPDETPGLPLPDVPEIPG